MSRKRLWLCDGGCTEGWLLRPFNSFMAGSITDVSFTFKQERYICYPDSYSSDVCACSLFLCSNVHSFSIMMVALGTAYQGLDDAFET